MLQTLKNHNFIINEAKPEYRKTKFGIDCSKDELQNQHIIQLHMSNCTMSYHDSTSAPKREKHLSSGGMITRVI